MLFKNTYTAIDRDMQRIEPGQHQAVRIENPLLARPILVTALRSPKKLTWKQAQKWAASLDVYGWSWCGRESWRAPCRRQRAEAPLSGDARASHRCEAAEVRQGESVARDRDCGRASSG